MLTLYITAEVGDEEIDLGLDGKTFKSMSAISKRLHELAEQFEDKRDLGEKHAAHPMGLVVAADVDQYPGVREQLRARLGKTFTESLLCDPLKSAAIRILSGQRSGRSVGDAEVSWTIQNSGGGKHRFGDN